MRSSRVLIKGVVMWLRKLLGWKLVVKIRWETFIEHLNILFVDFVVIRALFLTQFFGANHRSK